jgi:hypothetical protein
MRPIAVSHRIDDQPVDHARAHALLFDPPAYLAAYFVIILVLQCIAGGFSEYFAENPLFEIAIYSCVSFRVII